LVFRILIQYNLMKIFYICNQSFQLLWQWCVYRIIHSNSVRLLIISQSESIEILVGKVLFRLVMPVKALKEREGPGKLVFLLLWQRGCVLLKNLPGSVGKFFCNCFAGRSDFEGGCVDPSTILFLLNMHLFKIKCRHFCVAIEYIATQQDQWNHKKKTKGSGPGFWIHIARSKVLVHITGLDSWLRVPPC